MHRKENRGTFAEEGSKAEGLRAPFSRTHAHLGNTFNDATMMNASAAVSAGVQEAQNASDGPAFFSSRSFFHLVEASVADFRAELLTPLIGECFELFKRRSETVIGVISNQANFSRLVQMSVLVQR
jgi:hypothetical protein